MRWPPVLRLRTAGRHLLPPVPTLTCDSVIPREYASLALSGPAKYLVCSKVFSRAKIWCPVKVGRVCFFLWMLSLRGSGAVGGRTSAVSRVSGVPALPCPASPPGRAPSYREATEAGGRRVRTSLIEQHSRQSDNSDVDLCLGGQTPAEKVPQVTAAWIQRELRTCLGPMPL